MVKVLGIFVIGLEDCWVVNVWLKNSWIDWLIDIVRGDFLGDWGLKEREI